MDLERFCTTSRVVIVAGKGGVGKTTVTATLASAAARAGMSVLIVEVEGKSGLAALYDAPELGYEEAELDRSVTARTLTPDDALLEYLDDHGLRRISRRLVHSGAVDVVATAVPGMKDILVLGKVKQLEREGRFDLVILDAPAAGHAVSFLMSARGLLDAVSVGLIRRQAVEVVDLLADPDRCQVLLVTLPEETPVNELVEVAYALEDRIGVALGPVIVNGCYQDVRFDGLDLASVCADAARLDVFVSEREAADLLHAASFRAARHDLQEQQVARLARRLPLPELRLPFLFSADLGPAELETLVDAFILGVALLPEPAA